MTKERGLYITEKLGWSRRKGGLENVGGNLGGDTKKILPEKDVL